MSSTLLPRPTRRTQPPATGILPALAEAAPGSSVARPALLLATAAVLVWPRLPLEGLPPWVGMATWLAAWAAGLAGSWLGGRWWGCPSAALVCGVAWQAAVAPLPPAELAILSFLPLGWGLLLRAAAGPTLPALFAAALAPAALLSLGERALHAYLLLAVPALVAKSRVSGILGLLSAVYGITGVTLLLSAPYVAWTEGRGPGLTTPDFPLATAVLATAALWRGRQNVRRLALPVLAVIGGLGLPGAATISVLGLAVLAGGSVADWDRRLGWAAAAAVVAGAVATAG